MVQQAMRPCKCSRWCLSKIIDVVDIIEKYDNRTNNTAGISNDVTTGRLALQNHNQSYSRTIDITNIIRKRCCSKTTDTANTIRKRWCSRIPNTTNTKSYYSRIIGSMNQYDRTNNNVNVKQVKRSCSKTITTTLGKRDNVSSFSQF